MNDDRTRIEYRDSYGNLLGYRTWENKYTETTNIEVGQCYRFERNTMTKVTNCFSSDVNNQYYYRVLKVEKESCDIGFIHIGTVIRVTVTDGVETK